MKTKKGVLRVIEVEDGFNYRPSCMLYKFEIPFFVAKLKSAGVAKYRWRLLGRDGWHIENI